MLGLTALESALDVIDAPIVQARTPGLNRDQLIDLVSSTYPSVGPYIDDEILAWWGWQNGLDPEGQKHIRQRNPAFTAINLIAPDGLSLSALQGMLLASEGIREFLEVGAVASFPIGGSSDGGRYYVRKYQKLDPWRVSKTDKELNGWMTGPEPLGPTFDDYLTALAAAIAAGRVGIASWGGLARLDSNVTSDWQYPWT